MKDPALGSTRAENSGMAPVIRNRNAEFRNANVGQYSGPRPSYVPYEVSEQAQDVLNKQIRSYNK
jgi:hypothetical protein